MSSIRLEHIDKAYDDNQILKDFSVEIDSHEMISVIGGSGSGKTTMLKLINGLLLPDQGHVYIDGIDIQTINQNELRRHIGYVIQNIGLFPHMNIEDNISYVLRLQKTDPQMIKERVHELIVMMDLDQDILKRYPDELSGGQKQRIGIARALAANPQIILMMKLLELLMKLLDMAYKMNFYVFIKKFHLHLFLLLITYRKLFA